YLAFALNSLVFLLIGFEVQVTTLLRAWLPILVAFLAVTIGRAVVVHLVALLLRRTQERLPRGWAAVLTWGGLRGGLSMVLVLGLPASTPHRELLVTMTFGVVILSIFLQGVTMSTLLRRFGLLGADRPQEYEMLRARLRLSHAALTEIARIEGESSHADDVVASVRAHYREALSSNEARIGSVREESMRAQEEALVRRRAVTAQKAALLSLHRDGEIGDECTAQLQSELDEELRRHASESH
ncbi:MAG: cation:proton antiporter, partial [Polyangiales bacterium]